MSEAAEEAKKEFAKQAVQLIFMVMALLIMMAVQKPDFLSSQIMKLAEASRRLLASAARRAGHISMGIELAAGRQEYTVPLILSRLRDKASEAYDKARRSA